ncbi:hypothetical protein DXT96_06860 [Agrobacterium sp. ICMP 6402]|uniref:hypothetical protein n=1 Tax=Agrobacterium sp. ICMP 6402 TaxID=2292443 RepID=UPI001294C297|nr:hypothetical protein [Agrobacterium sp. ICMP 6402]MQB09575.1 hypothetical protein [Agrobacterium sp. ICMP 6402]
MNALEEIKKVLEDVAPGPWFDWETNEWLVDPQRLLCRYVDASFIARCDPLAISELVSTLESLQRENEELREKAALHSADAKTAWAECDELRGLADRLKMEAQTHAMEARGANATINEIYQIITGGKGEPGTWNGAEPVRAYVEVAKGDILRLETELALSKPVYSRRLLEDRVKTLEKALTPFGRAITYCEQLRKHGGDDSVRAHDFVISDEFRCARTALASTGGEHHAE